MMNLIMRLWKDEEGQGMVEYGLIIALVSIVAIAALVLVGDEIKAVFNNVVTELGGTAAD